MTILDIHENISDVQQIIPNNEVLSVYNIVGKKLGFTGRKQATDYFLQSHKKGEQLRYAISTVTAFCFATSPLGDIVFFSSIKKGRIKQLESKTIAGHSIATFSGDENMIKEGYEETTYKKGRGLNFSIHKEFKPLYKLEKAQSPSLVFIDESVHKMPRIHNKTGEQYLALEMVRFYLGYMPYKTKVHNNEIEKIKKTSIQELGISFREKPESYTPGLIYLWEKYRNIVDDFLDVPDTLSSKDFGSILHG